MHVHLFASRRCCNYNPISTKVHENAEDAKYWYLYCTITVRRLLLFGVIKASQSFKGMTNWWDIPLDIQVAVDTGRKETGHRQEETGHGQEETPAFEEVHL